VSVASTPAIRAARPADFGAVAGLLRSNNLPVDGVPPSLEAFLVAVRDGTVVGLVGLERYGTDALLRSAVVDASERGTGLGAGLIDGILAEAQERGVTVLWLLTTTAERWFPRFGFTIVTRDDVPPMVRASREFQGACPASATVMRRAR